MVSPASTIVGGEVLAAGMGAAVGRQGFDTGALVGGAIGACCVGAGATIGGGKQQLPEEVKRLPGEASEGHKRSICRPHSISGTRILRTHLRNQSAIILGGRDPKLARKSPLSSTLTRNSLFFENDPKYSLMMQMRTPK